jgi:hypothetical protein
VGPLLHGKYGLYFNLYIDQNDGMLWNKKGPASRVQIDMIRFKNGYVPIVGQKIDKSQIAAVYDIKGSVSGAIEDVQKRRIFAATGHSPTAVIPESIWTRIKKWIPHPKYERHRVALKLVAKSVTMIIAGALIMNADQDQLSFDFCYALMQAINEYKEFGAGERSIDLTRGAMDRIWLWLSAMGAPDVAVISVEGAFRVMMSNGEDKWFTTETLSLYK